MNNEVVIYQSSDGLVKMEAIVDASNETIWATQKAMAQLFGVSISGISRHLVNVFSSGELDEKSNLQKMQIAKSDKPVAFYSLDVIISVGYRVNSIRATAFGWHQKNRRRHPCRIDPDDCRKPDGRDGYPCQGGRESYKQKTINHGIMSDFKETCIWMSYRYAIGRKAIASVMHAEDIAKHMEWVPMDRWAFTGMDILREVNDRIGWYKNIHIESYGDPTIDVFSVIFQWFEDNPQKDEIEYFVKHEWYVDLVKGEVVRVEERTQDIPERTDWGSYVIDNIFSDYSDYKNWVKLANLFLQKHRMVTTEFNGKVETQKIYEWWDVRVRMGGVTFEKRYSTEDGYMQGRYIGQEYIRDEE